MNTDITVIIPAYNAEATLLRAISSVKNQLVSPNEIIVVDDGSSDNTLEIANSISEIKVVSQKNSGAASARNNGVKHAQSTWVSFLDADDEWAANKIASVKNAISNNTLGKTSIISHNMYENHPQRLPKKIKLIRYYNPCRNLFSQLYLRNFLATSTITCKKSDYIKVGGMDEDLRSAQDYDLWLKLSAIGNLIFINETLSTYHITKGSITFNSELRYQCMRKVLLRHSKNTGYWSILKRWAIFNKETVKSSLTKKNISLLKRFIFFESIPFLFQLFQERHNSAQKNSIFR